MITNESKYGPNLFGGFQIAGTRREDGDGRLWRMAVQVNNSTASPVVYLLRGTQIWGLKVDVMQNGAKATHPIPVYVSSELKAAIQQAAEQWEAGPPNGTW